MVPPFGHIYGSYRHLYRKGFLNPPLSIAYIAAAATSAGHTVKIIDGEAENLSDQEMIIQAAEFGPDLLAYTATSVDFDRVLNLAEEMKKTFTAVPSIIGGTHVNIFGAEILEQSDTFDFACIGDGEDLIVELMEALDAGGGKRFGDIPGLIHRVDGKVAVNELRPVERNIDRYPFPRRDLLNNDLYIRGVPYNGYQKTAALISSRGCPYSCIYCAVKNIHGGSRVRLRTSENVLDEVESVVKDFGIRHISFNDDCLTLDRKRMLEFCAGIASRNLHFTWEGLSRADLVDRDLLKTMFDAGFVRISFGIESGNPELLRMIDKRETLEQIQEAFRIAKEVGIVTRGSVIIGLPYETRGTVMDTFNFITKLKGIDQVVINILQPYPGTKVREMVLAGEGGTRFLDSPDTCKNLQRFGSATVAVNDLGPGDLIYLQKLGFLRFYLRPRVVFNNLRLTGVKTFTGEAFNFMRSILGI